MEAAATDDEYQKKERTVLVIVLVFASVAISSLLVAFSYYCYIRNKVSKRIKELKSRSFFSFWFSYEECSFLFTS